MQRGRQVIGRPVSNGRQLRRDVERGVGVQQMIAQGRADGAFDGGAAAGEVEGVEAGVQAKAERHVGDPAALDDAAGVQLGIFTSVP